MSTKADFYLGRGPSARWIGSLEWDGMPSAIPLSIRQATKEGEYLLGVGSLLENRPDAQHPDQGWPWSHTSSLSTPYSYAFDSGVVYASCYGSSWWEAKAEEPDHTTLTAKAASFPLRGGITDT